MCPVTYKKSGVDIRKADEFIGDLQKIFARRGINRSAAFGSLFSLTPLLKTCKRPVLVSSSDGVGTKLLLARRFRAHYNVGIDLVAMNTNDIVCLGARPLFFLDYIACGKLNRRVLLDVARGIKKGLADSGCVLLGGETAEMPGVYGRDEYDLAGFCVGLVEEKKIIDGSKIKAGDVVIGLESNGLHSNGFSLVRKVLKKAEIKKYAKKLLVPTRIYVKPILSLLSAMSYQLSAIKGIAHITGGAFFNKATKILPPGSGLVISKESWRVPEIFRIIQKKGKISEPEMYTVFNMGIGMIMVVDKARAEKIMRFMQKRIRAHIIGEVRGSHKRMVLK
jgi:phosphoribosylformylglycinamidine cyclo-ligase